MRNLLKYIFALGMGLSTYSCDFLDKPILGSESLDAYFYNETECDKYVTGLYQYITNNAWSPVYMWWIMTDLCTDDGWMGSTYQPAKYVEFQPVVHYEGTTETTTNVYLNGFWECRYKGIAEANIGIDRIEKADISLQKKKQFIAEAKFLRSFFYFDLVRNFGGVPLVLKQLSTTESLSVSRSSVADVYERIESDLKEVSSSLPYKSEMSYESGRANKGMAQALLAKHICTKINLMKHIFMLIL